MNIRSLPMANPRTSEQLEQYALGLLKRFCPHCLTEPEPVPVKDILEYELECNFGVPFHVVRLPFGYEAVTHPAKGLQGVRVEMQPEVFALLCRDNGRARFTAGHEICHAILHMSEIDVELVDGEVAGLYQESTIPWDRNPERQADIFASRLLMPAAMMHLALDSLRRPDARFVAGTFKVSKSAAEVRMSELGYR